MECYSGVVGLSVCLSVCQSVCQSAGFVCCVRLTTASGLLLKPSRPATATDVQMLQVTVTITVK